MLKRPHRLGKKDNLESILKNGGKALGRLLVLRMRKNNQNTHRFGIVISQKVGRQAVDRNRIKRQINDIVRLNYEKLPEENHFDILILPKTAIMEATYDQIKADFLSLIPRLK
jgi:ribonuclease P protein component